MIIVTQPTIQHGAISALAFSVNNENALVLGPVKMRGEENVFIQARYTNIGGTSPVFAMQVEESIDGDLWNVVLNGPAVTSGTGEISQVYRLAGAAARFYRVKVRLESGSTTTGKLNVSLYGT